MQSPEQFVQELFLSHDYDPTKRHEYYLKTRQLKGRGKGPEFEISGHTRPATQISSTKKSTLAKPRKTVQEQVDDLKARLAKLKTVLDELVKAAQERSGVEPADPGKSKDAPKQTAKQKADAAKRAKDYAKKHKNDKPQTPSQQLKELQSQIKAMQAKIKQARADLEKAKKKPKSKTGSVGASEFHIHD